MFNNSNHLTTAEKDTPSVDSIEAIIKQVKELGYSKCAERISFLDKVDDLEEGDKPLKLESAKGFLNFFKQFEFLGKPMLGLFPAGTLSVGWKIADNKHLLVEPINSHYVVFAMIGPSDSNPGEKFRLSGRGEIEEIIRTLKSQGVHQWIDS